ncbi:hypothetical protein BBF96_01845 [Anoxybacter fermentans]|uniref:Methyltransferase domain-containing protein n=1 Tax=Anoxybacter fermentans TaxID=1323375 RepID=A0A3S9SVA8_9FIRM|nr:methyltransferase domain-containing protein [Anoxybacter fermentans]AZR72247.1 hypothetical protein BBF96_01845 [Anoxybacter fermentans]
MSREFFNQKAEKWDQIVNHDSIKIRKVLDGLPDIVNPEILDVGSGTGVLIPFLKERYGERVRITAIDFAEKMIEVSKKKHRDYSNIEFIVGDIYSYPLTERKYDLILCYSVFPHLKDKEGILRRFGLLLKHGGWLVIFHSESRENINNLHHKAGKEVKEDYLPPADQVVKMAEKFGYNAKRVVDDDRMYLVELLYLN